MTEAGSEETPRSWTLREVAKFAIPAAVFAMFIDAALGHGLAWENDPYWSYWITDTLLIATVFGLGTAWLGLGAGRGAILAAAQTLVLTVYYWSFAPIGLPASPHWLDFEHTWLTGLPIHFSVYYLGYLTALWLRRRRPVAADTGPPARDALAALITAIAVLVLAGGGAALALGDFPGVTWFVMRFAITVPIILMWWSLAGRDLVGALSGAVVLALAWAAYGDYLGPTGLPDTPLRLLDEAPPSSTVEWLSYRELWLISVPVYVAAMALVLTAATRLFRGARQPSTAGGPRARAGLRAAAGLPLVLVVPLLIALPAASDASGSASLEAAGPASIEVPPRDGGPMASSESSLSARVEDSRRRTTPQPPHDDVLLEATIEHPAGQAFEVRASTALVNEPRGRHTTWRGVGLDVWQHGRTGIGSGDLPEMQADVAVFALGEVRTGGRLVASRVPIQLSAHGDGEGDRALELHVGDPDAPVAGLPGGRLHVAWDRVLHVGQSDDGLRYGVGAAVLAGLLVFALGANGVMPRRR